MRTMRIECWKLQIIWQTKPNKCKKATKENTGSLLLKIFDSQVIIEASHENCSNNAIQGLKSEVLQDDSRGSGGQLGEHWKPIEKMHIMAKNNRAIG